METLQETCPHIGTKGEIKDKFCTCLNCGKIIPNRERHLSNKEFIEKHGCTKAEYVLQDMSKEERSVIESLADEIKTHLL